MQIEYVCDATQGLYTTCEMRFDRKFDRECARDAAVEPPRRQLSDCRLQAGNRHRSLIHCNFAFVDPKKIKTLVLFECPP